MQDLLELLLNNPYPGRGIVVGKGGSMIKLVGTEARRDIERLLGRRVYLDLSVRVRPQWRRDANEIRRLGYGAED